LITPVSGNPSVTSSRVEATSTPVTRTSSLTCTPAPSSWIGWSNWRATEMNPEHAMAAATSTQTETLRGAWPNCVAQIPYPASATASSHGIAPRVMGSTSTSTTKRGSEQRERERRAPPARRTAEVRDVLGDLRFQLGPAGV
jgi:hypothetical protein